jgi:tetratricopeptide (TPR) repeat protein
MKLPRGRRPRFAASASPGAQRPVLRKAIAPSDRLERARQAYERDRYEECLRQLRRLEEERPLGLEGLELRALSLYRIGRYEAARRVFASYREESGLVDHVPVEMDCARALGRSEEVESLWEELRRISPGKEVIVEGRLVYAGYLADRGRLEDAIALVRRGVGREHRSSALTSLRQRYLLATLLERAGNIAEARALYQDLASEDPELYDVVARLAALT